MSALKITTTHGEACADCGEAAANAEGIVRCTGSVSGSATIVEPSGRVHVAVVTREAA